MNRKECHKRLKDIFMELGSVPQSYDIEWWSKREHAECVNRFGSKKTFEDVVDISVDAILDGAGESNIDDS